MTLIQFHMANELGDALRKAREAKGLKKVGVARMLDISPSAISQWESGTTTPSPENLLRVAHVFDIVLNEPPFKEAIERSGAAGPKIAAAAGQTLRNRFAYGLDVSEQNVRQAVSAPPISSLQGLARDVPVRGIAVGGDDADFQMNGQENDYAIRPPGLANVKGLFALVVSNDSMYPAWRPNATFYINPNRAPQIGDDVVVEMLPDDSGEPGKAFLKRLKSRTPTKVIVEQFNPPMDIEFERAAVRLHRVVPWEEALGIS
ncbi:XRE family transcriptional regulator [Methylobacterium sp. Leaf466]|uniref:XRE family transcriptional regulator n=1 Tax=Methylobacterium sp. Leaf466 TaxID=1736386 RepID=UPI0009ECA9C3|nr:XRE family transcriptional regulator [Methylobacterium sp. Leaf466]